MSGMDVVKHIQARRALSPAVRVIMVSGNEPSDAERDAFQQAGADGFWVKPITTRQLATLTR